MSNYDELDEFDLLARVYLIETEFGGRQGAVYDGYRGQFFWHINDVNCSDWDASYQKILKNTLKVFFLLIVNSV